MTKYLVFLGMIVSLTGIISYIKDMLKGGAKPNRITWLMWSIAPLIAAAAALKSGVTLAVVPVFMSGFGPLLVFIFSLFVKKAYWKISRNDIICGVLSLLALILWAITNNPMIAIIFSIASDALAAVPTLIKAWKYPETESSSAFIAALFSSITTFFAIEIWNFYSLAFPMYLVLMNIMLIFSIEHKKIQKKLVKI